MFSPAPYHSILPYSCSPSQVRKLKLRGVKSYVQGHSASEGRNVILSNSKPSCLPVLNAYSNSGWKHSSGS